MIVGCGLRYLLLGEEGVLPAALWWYLYGGNEARDHFEVSIPGYHRNCFLLELNIRACRFNNSNTLVLYDKDMLSSGLLQYL